MVCGDDAEARFGGVLPDGRGLLSASCMQVRLTKAFASFDWLTQLDWISYF